MKPDKAQIWFEIRVSGEPKILEEALPLLAERWGGFQFREEGSAVQASFYLASIADLEAFRQEVAALGLVLENVSEIADQDWGRVWKENFKPLRISKRIWIYPPWERLEVPKGEIGLVIDPGQAFGTGHHPTTALMLRALDELFERKRPVSVLDVGTGTGILALAAARLGAHNVLALDIDPEAVEAARKNASLNQLPLEVSLQRVEDLAEKFELVMANISAWELKRLAGSLAERTSPGGCLFLAGFLVKEMAEMKVCYLSLGLRCIAEKELDEWGFLAFSREAR